MRDDDWYKPHPDRPAALPRQPKPGEEVWRLRDNETGRVQTCELRDNSRAGAGWEVQILEAGEILVSRRCENEREARYVAEAARKDSLRTGSTAVESDRGWQPLVKVWLRSTGDASLGAALLLAQIHSVFSRWRADIACKAL